MNVRMQLLRQLGTIYLLLLPQLAPLRSDFWGPGGYIYIYIYIYIYTCEDPGDANIYIYIYMYYIYAWEH